MSYKQLEEVVNLLKSYQEKYETLEDKSKYLFLEYLFNIVKGGPGSGKRGHKVPITGKQMLMDHPNWSLKDYKHLTNKGYSSEEIKKIWDTDKKDQKGPVKEPKPLDFKPMEPFKKSKGEIDKILNLLKGGPGSGPKPGGGIRGKWQPTTDPFIFQKKDYEHHKKMSQYHDQKHKEVSEMVDKLEAKGDRVNSAIAKEHAHEHKFQSGKHERAAKKKYDKEKHGNLEFTESGSNSYAKQYLGQTGIFQKSEENKKEDK